MLYEVYIRRIQIVLKKKRGAGERENTRRGKSQKNKKYYMMCTHIYIDYNLHTYI